MEGEEETQKGRRASTKHSEKTDLTDVTILSTPRPKATSTVERRLYGARDLASDFASDKYRRLYDSPTDSFKGSPNTTDDSLGILDNIPSFFSNDSATEKNKLNFGAVSDERELARKLLQRCSELHHLSNYILDGDKENNANSPNLSEERTPSTLIDSGQSFNLTPMVSKEQNVTRTPGDKISTASVNFEPNEISARSSAMSKSLEKKDAQSSEESTGGISFGSATAQLMAQFESEDFQSASLMSNQLLADELSFQQNAMYALPVATSTEKEHLSLSCFSGIIGDLELTVDSSCVGRKVSVGEFFKRKCGNVGQLSDGEEASERPDFGTNIRSPKRIGKNVPLVDLSTMTEDSTSDTKSDKMLKSFTETTKEHTIMSLSTIAQALKDIDNGTPRRLVDQLLMAKKQKKLCQKAQAHNLTSDTYTLPMSNCRNSLPVCSSVDSTKIDKEQILHSRNAKLSLDSKNISHASGIKYQESSRGGELGETVDYDPENTLAEILGEKLTSISNDVQNTSIASPHMEKIDVKKFSHIKEERQGQNKTGNDMSSKSREHRGDTKNRRSTDLPRCITQSMIKKEDTTAQRSALEATVATNSSNDQIRLHENVEIGKNTEELQHCIVGVRREVDVELVNKSHRWIICAPSWTQIQGDKNDIEFELAAKTMLIPESNKTIKIGVKVLKSTKPIRATVDLEMLEMQTRSTWHMQHTMWFVPEEPKIVIIPPTDKDELEFETSVDRPSKTKSIVIENKNSIDVPLKLSIMDNDEDMFRVECAEDQPSGQCNRENESLCILLKPSERFKATVRYNGTPSIDRKKNEPVKFSAKLVLIIQEREEKLLIKEIPLVGYAITIKTAPHAADRLSDNFRCETPQHVAALTSPTSPHSSTSNRSGTSGRNSPLSSASGGTVAGDVVSIRATHAALVWNSIKVGKSDTKEFTIRNTSNNKIKLQATIVDNDNSFKFFRERHYVPNIVLSLQRIESRTFSVVFSPNSSGPAAGRIVFKHYEPRRLEGRDSRPSKVIFLYGYGGVGKVEITEAFKDTGGQLWLSLGSLNVGGTLDAKIKLQNTGDLCSYAKIKLTPKAVYPAMVSSWHVDPTELLLRPKEVRWVTLEFRPRKEDLALLRRANVSHVGTLTITHGDEPTRLRIRRLYKKLSQNGQMSGKENEAFRNVVYPICKVFPGEVPINNLSIIRDSVENLGDLCRGVLQHEVMLTMEVNAEETMSILHDNADDTQTFYSLCSDNSLVFPATDDSFMPSETLMECTVDQRMYEDDFNVNPTSVTLKPPTVNEATIMIMSSSSVAQPFDTMLSHGEFLSVLPAEGMIPARRGFPIRVQCKKRTEQSINAILQVYTENDRRDVHIRVVI